VKNFNSSIDLITFSSFKFHSKFIQKKYVKGHLRLGILSIFVRFTLFVAKAQRHLYRAAGIFFVSKIILVFHFFSFNSIFEFFGTITKNLVVFQS
jgi:hypothetical protein